MDVWTFSTEHVTEPIDVEGFDVEATDGSIGKIDEATYDVGSACIVVDTGPWIFGRKVVIPAGAIETIDLENEKVVVRLTKDQIKDSPSSATRPTTAPTSTVRAWAATTTRTCAAESRHAASPCAGGREREGPPAHQRVQLARRSARYRRAIG